MIMFLVFRSIMVEIISLCVQRERERERERERGEKERKFLGLGSSSIKSTRKLKQ